MSPLEAQLTALTQDFVAKLVEAIRSASFADVAGLTARGRPVKVEPSPARRGLRAPVAAGESAPRGATRQTAKHRAEVGERVVEALRGSSGPMGVRALASELGIPSDRLAGPLKELRAAGRIRKHGDKRATTYSTP